MKAKNDTRALDGVETRAGGKEKSYSMAAHLRGLAVEWFSPLTYKTTIASARLRVGRYLTG